MDRIQALKDLMSKLQYISIDVSPPVKSIEKIGRFQITEETNTSLGLKLDRVRFLQSADFGELSDNSDDYIIKNNIGLYCYYKIRKSDLPLIPDNVTMITINNIGFTIDNTVTKCKDDPDIVCLRLSGIF